MVDIDHDHSQSVGSVAANIVSGLSVERVYQGGQITEPGIYRGIPIDDYHGDTDLFPGFSISSSGLRKVLDRPSAYWAFSPYNPKPFEQEEKSALEFGKAAHMLLLGEDGFADRYVLRPKEFSDYKSAAAKSWRNDAKAAGKVVITETEINHIKFIRDSLGRHPLVKLGLMNGRIERSLIMEENGIWIKGRPDVIPNGSGDIVDLKTTASLDYESLSKTVFNNGYHVQAGLIRKLIRELIGKDAFTSFSFIFVEKTPPYDVRVMQLKDADIDLGERLADRALATVAECLKRNQWPGYDGFDPDVSFVEIPSWARTRTEIELQREAA